MSIQPNLDPLVPSNWGPAEGPVFATNEEEHVYGPGHAAFVTSPGMKTNSYISYC